MPIPDSKASRENSVITTYVYASYIFEHTCARRSPVEHQPTTLPNSTSSGCYAHMKIITATAARNRFGKLIDVAQSEPVRVQRQGRDVAVVLSPEEFRRLSEAASSKVSPVVQKLHTASAKRWSKVYEAPASTSSS